MNAVLAGLITERMRDAALASSPVAADQSGAVPSMYLCAGPSQWTLSPLLVAASSGLSEEALAGEASEAAAGDVDGCLVGGHTEEFVQLTGSEPLIGMLVEGVHDGLVGGVRLGRCGLA